MGCYDATNIWADTIIHRETPGNFGKTRETLENSVKVRKQFDVKQWSK